MIRLKTEKDIELLRESGKRLATVLHEVAAAVRPGITTAELDALAALRIKALGDRSAFLNYRPAGASRPYPATLCTSVNEEIVHGIPSSRVLEEGDIVGVDLGLVHKERFTDMAITVAVGQVSPAIQKFIDTAKLALEVAIEAAQPGAHVGDIGAAVEAVVRPAGYGIAEELAGHGVGFGVHEDPFVPNTGKKGQGMELKPGLVIAIEPMITMGSEHIELEDDGFTFTTKDGRMSAHFEHTVLITENGPEILTNL